MSLFGITECQACSVARRCLCPRAKVSRPVIASIGWVCPVCGKGNAPHVEGCFHCARIEITLVPARTMAHGPGSAS